MVIAIDGPSGAGKSEVSRRLAAHLGIAYLDTGALYRAVGYKALSVGVPPDDGAALEGMLCCTTLDALCRQGGSPRVVLDGKDVTDELYTQPVAEAASRVSAHRAVRAWLLRRQRDIARTSDAVLDGRDIGTQVFPDAQVKIYLTASAEVRARRRVNQLLESGQKADYWDVLRQVNERDQRDMSRAVSPLRRARDAYFIDSSEMSIDQVVEEILGRVKRARPGG